MGVKGSETFRFCVRYLTPSKALEWERRLDTIEGQRETQFGLNFVLKYIPKVEVR